jgi:TRAP-type C4-dicarboxylate transport system substrate-binding protein
MGWPIYSELQQGTIDGQENPLWVFEEYKLYEVQKYLALTGHVYSVHIDIANLQWFEALPKETQTMFETAMRDAAIYQRKVNREKEAEYLATLKEKGMIIDEHPDMNSFREMVKPMKNMDMYKEPKTRALLDKLLDATK